MVGHDHPAGVEDGTNFDNDSSSCQYKWWSRQLAFNVGQHCEAFRPNVLTMVTTLPVGLQAAAKSCTIVQRRFGFLNQRGVCNLHGTGLFTSDIQLHAFGWNYSGTDVAHWRRRNVFHLLQFQLW
jgi:hypothetical protein